MRRNCCPRSRGKESFQYRLTSRRVSRSLRRRAEQLNWRSQRIWLRLLPSHILTHCQQQKRKKHPCESRQPRGSRLARRNILQADCYPRTRDMPPSASGSEYPRQQPARACFLLTAADEKSRTAIGMIAAALVLDGWKSYHGKIQEEHRKAWKSVSVGLFLANCEAEPMCYETCQSVEH